VRVSDIFARLAGGATGALAAIAVPHVGCLAAITPIFVSLGGGTAVAVGATYAAGALILLGGGAAAWYALRPEREVCCETRTPLRKGIALAACAFTVAAAFNTYADSGVDIEARAQYMEEDRVAGGSVWEAHRRLEEICGSRRWWFRP